MVCLRISLSRSTDSTSWLAIGLTVAMANVACSQGIYVEKLLVQQESSLDWRYAAEQTAGRTIDSERLKTYKASNQLYDLYGPRHAPTNALPLILCISPGQVPLEWKRFAPVCRKHGVLFAGVRNAGNAQDPLIRIRAAVEVLSDVRRRYRVDPDRTYVAGFSGGATIATRLAFSLPECFGGLFCVGQRVVLPRTGALADRAQERIHIAALCGGNEIVGPEVEHVDVSVAIASGFHCRAFVSRGGGHRMPKSGVVDQAFRWLESGSEARKTLADRYPTTRLDSNRRYDGEAWASLLISEANDRWEAMEYATAVRLFRWIESRWPGSLASSQAAAKLRQLEQQSEFMEDEDQTARDRKALIDEAFATGYEKLAHDRRSWLTRRQRSQYASRAIRFMEASEIKDKDQAARIEKLEAIANPAGP